MWQSNREISRECNDIIGSAKGSQISEKYSDNRIFYFSVTETDTTTSGLRWIFHMRSEFSRSAMCNNAIMIIYKYRAPLRRIGHEYSAKVAFSIFQSLKRIQSLPVRSELI
jgi:hypothetical protein